MKGDRALILMETTHIKHESNTTMEYGVPRAIVPLEEIACRLGISPARLAAAFGKETQCHLQGTGTSTTA